MKMEKNNYMLFTVVLPSELLSSCVRTTETKALLLFTGLEVSGSLSTESENNNVNKVVREGNC